MLLDTRQPLEEQFNNHAEKLKKKGFLFARKSYKLILEKSPYADIIPVPGEEAAIKIRAPKYRKLELVDLLNNFNPLPVLVLQILPFGPNLCSQPVSPMITPKLSVERALGAWEEGRMRRRARREKRKNLSVLKDDRAKSSRDVPFGEQNQMKNMYEPYTSFVVNTIGGKVRKEDLLMSIEGGVLSEEAVGIINGKICELWDAQEGLMKSQKQVIFISENSSRNFMSQFLN